MMSTKKEWKRSVRRQHEDATRWADVLFSLHGAGLMWRLERVRNWFINLVAGMAAVAGVSAAEFPQSAFKEPVGLEVPAAEYPSVLGGVTEAREWPARREEIFQAWRKELGPWPTLLKAPEVRVASQIAKRGYTERKVEVQVAKEQFTPGYLLTPEGTGKFPAVLVVFYDPETSAGLSTNKLRDFGLQLAKRGFVTLSIGSPGGDARKPQLGDAVTQPLSYLAYAAANAQTALARRPEVDPKRIGIVGHSYGGKWALFAAALDDRFAAAAFSDPGIVFDETRPNVNYWEPWYLGFEPGKTRKQGVITATDGRTGAYKRLVESGRDLHELMALIAPRPFLVSGGSEDPPERWHALRRVNEVYHLLGATNKVAMTNRPGHDPTTESNEQIYAFFEKFLKEGAALQP
ncbi:MAG TPA: prolyl oligopeptidase family serine peptidase [Methylomirabilota bacterium]|nr:prolyl oligopeptidase family serine peptidase [Methylomirabilota bacterium]